MIPVVLTWGTADGAYGGRGLGDGAKASRSGGIGVLGALMGLIHASRLGKSYARG